MANHPFCKFSRTEEPFRSMLVHTPVGPNENSTQLLSNLRPICVRVFQLLEIVGVVDLENENPALAVGFTID